MLLDPGMSEPALLLVSDCELWVDQVIAEMVAALADDAAMDSTSSDVAAAAAEPVPSSEQVVVG